MGHEALPVPLGTVLGGRYRLDAVLGRGGFGAVYRATQLDLGRPVALKVLHAQAVLGDALMRFEREARATSSLGHPHIVQVTDFQAAPTPFLVMELLPGRSLAETLQLEGRLEAHRAVRVGLQMLSALAATHRVGIVHRDIKPANVMLVPSATGEDMVKVLDFGVAKDLNAPTGNVHTQSGQLLGTVGYMAPEQAMGHGVGPRTDVYSVGVVLYRALCGARPYGEATGADLVRLLLTGVPFAPLHSRAPALPPQLCTLIDRALATDPQQRPPSAEAFAAELAVCMGMPVPPWASGVMAPPMFSMPPSRMPPSSIAATKTHGTLPTQSAAQSMAPLGAPSASPRSAAWLFVVGAGLLLLSVMGIGGVVLVLRADRGLGASSVVPSAPSGRTSAASSGPVVDPEPRSTNDSPVPVTSSGSIAAARPGPAAPALPAALRDASRRWSAPGSRQRWRRRARCGWP